jgi:hypothetical protein
LSITNYKEIATAYDLPQFLGHHILSEYTTVFILQITIGETILATGLDHFRSMFSIFIDSYGQRFSVVACVWFG